MKNDNPKYRELDAMINFAIMNPNLYILGNGLKQKRLKKYLDQVGINIKSFIVSDTKYFCNCDCESEITIHHLLENKEKVGIIVGLSDTYYNQVLPYIIKNPNIELFFMSEYNKTTIAHKMSPYRKEEFHLEISIAQHCNLNCQMCDHFSPIAEKEFYDLANLKRI